MAKKIHIAFLWHMHQPPYEDPFTGIFLLPWTYLHATKDYYDMLAVVAKHPRMRANFNLTMSLLEQIQKYALREAKDQTLEVCSQDPADLDGESREFLLRTCFDGCAEPLIMRFPRYRQLYDFYRASRSAGEAANIFEAQEFTDLTTLFLLAWCGPTLQADPLVRALIGKKRGFTKEDRQKLVEISLRHIAKIIPYYREVAATGQVEVSTSPYYHPLMPLLVNSAAALEADPGVTLPEIRFVAPEEAERQIDLALEAFSRIFGGQPAGMWPPEGAISDAVLSMFARRKVKWIASDEEVLRRTMGGDVAAEERFYPLNYNGMALFFRNRVLSDNIGFVYCRWPLEKSVSHFMESLRELARQAPDDRGIVVVAMDGENAWEFYGDGGYPFLDALYSAIEASDFVEPVTLSEYLDRYGTGEEVAQVATGSWVDGNLNTWIGDPIKNRAWEALANAHRLVSSLPEKACKIHGVGGNNGGCPLLRAEASDWFWWFGRGHASVHKREFDYLFRQYLRAVYRRVGVAAPENLEEPLNDDLRVLRIKRPTALIHPRITGRKDSYYKWVGAGECSYEHGAIHRLSPIIEKVFFGFDRERFYLRCDGFQSLKGFLNELGFLRIHFLGPVEVTMNIRGCPAGCILEKVQAGFGVGLVTGAEVAVDDVLELAIPVAELGLGLGSRSRIEFYLTLGKGELEFERFPWDATIEMDFEPEDYESRNWFV